MLLYIISISHDNLCNFQKSLSVSNKEGGFIGAFWPSTTGYMEYQDGTFMTDGKLIDQYNYDYSSLNQSIHDELCLGTNSQIAGCDGNGGVLCEITLHNDTHICLDNGLLTSVKIDLSTKLDVPAQVSTQIFYKLRLVF